MPVPLNLTMLAAGLLTGETADKTAKTSGATRAGEAATDQGGATAERTAEAGAGVAPTAPHLNPELTSAA